MQILGKISVCFLPLAKQANKMKFGIIAFACLVAAVSASYDYKVGTVPMTVNQDFINLILRHPFQPIFVEEYRKYIETPVVDPERYVVSLTSKYFNEHRVLT